MTSDRAIILTMGLQPGRQAARAAAHAKDKRGCIIAFLINKAHRFQGAGESHV